MQLRKKNTRTPGTRPAGSFNFFRPRIHSPESNYRTNYYLGGCFGVCFCKPAQAICWKAIVVVIVQTEEDENEGGKQ